MAWTPFDRSIQGSLKIRNSGIQNGGIAAFLQRCPACAACRDAWLHLRRVSQSTRHKVVVPGCPDVPSRGAPRLDKFSRLLLISHQRSGKRAARREPDARKLMFKRQRQRLTSVGCSPRRHAQPALVAQKMQTGIIKDAKIEPVHCLSISRFWAVFKTVNERLSAVLTTIAARRHNNPMCYFIL